jgi:hypothetical protein
MAGKQYEVVRHFRRVDPESGDVTWHEPGEAYSGPMENEDHYLGDKGPDGKGPLIKSKSDIAEEKKIVEAAKSDAPATSPAASAPTSDSSKGK